MSCTRLLCAIGVSVWLVTTVIAAGGSAVPGGQTAPAVALTGELRAQVQNTRFQVVTSVRGLPLGVRRELQTLFRTPDLDIAEPDEAFQGAGAGANSRLPTRRLVAAGCSYERCLVYYERGGSARTWRVALFHWTPDVTTVEWGATAPGGLKSIDDVRREVLSGAIKGPPESW